MELSFKHYRTQPKIIYNIIYYAKFNVDTLPAGYRHGDGHHTA